MFRVVAHQRTFSVVGTLAAFWLGALPVHAQEHQAVVLPTSSIARPQLSVAHGVNGGQIVGCSGASLDSHATFGY
jgi:hypothetical protein